MQAWLLYIIYGAYACDTAQFEKAKQMLRQLVDVSTAFISDIFIIIYLTK
jgi:hypothetical protein